MTIIEKLSPFSLFNGGNGFSGLPQELKKSTIHDGCLSPGMIGM